LPLYGAGSDGIKDWIPWFPWSLRHITQDYSKLWRTIKLNYLRF